MIDTVLDGELAFVEVIMYGVAQLRLLPSGEKIKMILPKANQINVGDVYGISNDHLSLSLG